MHSRRAQFVRARRGLRLHPAQAVVTGFGIAVAAGTVLLMLPLSLIHI